MMWQPIEDAMTDKFYRVYDAYSDQIVTGIKMKAVSETGEDKGHVWFTGYTWGNTISIQRPTHFMQMEQKPTQSDNE